MSSSIEFKNHFSNTTPHLIVYFKLKALYLIMKGLNILKNNEMNKNETPSP